MWFFSHKALRGEMNGAFFILAINIAVAAFLAAAFLIIAGYEKTRVAGRWLAAAYILGIGYALMEFGIHWVDGSPPMVAGSAAILLLGMGAFNIGLAHRYRSKPPVFAALLIVAGGTLAAYLSTDLPRHSFTRMMTFQGPYFLMMVLAASIVLVRMRKRSDYLFAGILCLSALQFLSKPFIAHAVGGWGADPSAYLGSTYAQVSQSMGTVFAIMVALATMVLLVRDILRDATAKSEIDTLTGLHNRRGFERRASHAVESAVRRHTPTSLVISDLDHFKAVNDTYGHAAGDQVLIEFAGLLQQTAAGATTAGRIGGEEFAVLLSGANLAAARLFAEGARAAFSGMPIEGLPDDVRFTASFGVAELAPGENLDDLQRRSDDALYDAKRAGRDCVRVSLVERSAPKLIRVNR
jgi:diguanylate cyclase (GGDEF)-like protein